MQDEQREDIQEEQKPEQENQPAQDAQAIRFVILGIPYSIKPSDDLSAEDIEILIAYVKSRVESYTHKGYEQARIPMLVAFDIANELRELQKFYESPINSVIDKLKEALEQE